MKKNCGKRIAKSYFIKLEILGVVKFNFMKLNSKFLESCLLFIDRPKEIKF